MNDFMAESSLPRNRFPQGVSGFGKGKEARIIFQFCIQHDLLNTMGFLIVGGGVQEGVLTKWEDCHQVLGLWQSLQGLSILVGRISQEFSFLNCSVSGWARSIFCERLEGNFVKVSCLKV